jgi:biopolymer transport protein ExbD
MAFGQFNGVGGRSGKPMVAMSDINVTPMVDVMLVLLVIFILASPLMNHAIKLDLPKAQAELVTQNAETIRLSFDANGDLYWDNEVLSLPTLNTRLAGYAKRKPQPEIQLRADKATRYEIIAQVMAAAKNQGLQKISFVTDATSSANKENQKK